MDVRQQSQSVFLLYVTQHLQSLVDARSSERLDRRAVSLVERRLEYDVNPLVPIDFHQFGCYDVEQFSRFDDTWACNESFFHTEFVMRITLQR